MLTAIAVLMLILIALLAIPLTLKYELSWRQAFRANIRLLWMFGLVRIRLSPTETGTPEAAPATTARKITNKQSSSGKSNPMAAIRHKQFRQRIIRFLRDLWRAIHKQHVKLRIRIGLGDPADTGQLWAIAGPVSGILASVQDASIEIEPEFIDTVFEMDSSGNIRIIPLQIIYLTARLLLSPAIWQGINQMRKAGK